LALFDIKPLSRLIPEQSLLTGRGMLPVSGFVKKIGVVEKFKTLQKLIDDINIVKNKIKTNLKKTTKQKRRYKLDIGRLKVLQKKLRRERAKTRVSELPLLVRKAISGALEVPTEKIVKIGKLKVIGFSEQTVRKALGTLQVLIEKNIRRAKDPQAFLISLEIQLEILKKTKPKTALGRLVKTRRIKVLSDTIKLLKSKSFSRLLERKVPGLTKEFPLVSKIDIKKLKRIKPREIARKVKQRIKKLGKKQKREIIEAERTIKKRTSKIPKRKKKPSRLPKSKLPKRKVSKLPKSKLPKRKVSKLPKKKPSRIPISKLPKRPSRIPISRIPGKEISRLKISKLKKGKLTKSKLMKLERERKEKLYYKKERKVFKTEKQKIAKLKTLVDKRVKRQEFIYLPDLYSRIYGIRANPKEKIALLKKGKVFSGVGIRKLI